MSTESNFNPLRALVIAHPKFLAPNETVNIPVEGKSGNLQARNVIFFNAPISIGAKEAEKELHKGYQSIFKTFTAEIPDKSEMDVKDKSEQDVKRSDAQKKFTKVAIPTFSIGQGGIDPEQAARIAVYEAATYLAKNPERKVQFVCFTDKMGKENKEYYKNEISKRISECTQTKKYYDEMEKKVGKENMNDEVANRDANARLLEAFDRISVTNDRIEELGEEFNGVNAIVCPIASYDLNQCGPIAKAVCKLASEKKFVDNYKVSQEGEGIELTRPKDFVNYEKGFSLQPSKNQQDVKSNVANEENNDKIHIEQKKDASGQGVDTKDDKKQ